MILNRYISKFFIVLVFIVIIQLIFFNILSLASEVSSTNNSTGNLQIYSESAILIEEKTGKVLYEKGMHDRKYPASTTKVLTAILAIENCNLSDTATASYEAVNSIKSGYTKANIQPGETFTIEELLDVLILQSANEAANVIAEHISGSVSEFANLMNQKAKEIGADLVMGTDPDCDRVGVALKDSNGEFVYLTGNQIGSIISDYLITNKKNIKNPYIVKTIVTTELGRVMCEANNIKLYNVLTGFKWIAEKIASTTDGEYLFGFEESFGYCINIQFSPPLNMWFLENFIIGT